MLDRLALNPVAIDARPDPRGCLVILTPTEGDRRIPWDPSDPAQVAEARGRFDGLIAEGYRAYRVGRRGQRGDRITEFDPLAGEILFTGKRGYYGG